MLSAGRPVVAHSSMAACTAHFISTFALHRGVPTRAGPNLDNPGVPACLPDLAERTARQLAADPRHSLARCHALHVVRVRGRSRASTCSAGAAAGGAASAGSRARSRAGAAGAAAAGGCPARGRAAGRGEGAAAGAAARGCAACVPSQAGDWADAPNTRGNEEPGGAGARG